MFLDGLILSCGFVVFGVGSLICWSWALGVVFLLKFSQIENRFQYD